MHPTKIFSSTQLGIAVMCQRNQLSLLYAQSQGMHNRVQPIDVLEIRLHHLTA